MIALFGRTRRLDSFTAGDADRFRQSLPGSRTARKRKAGKKKTAAVVKKKLSPNTVNRRCGIAKQFFEAAVKDRLIPANPFAGLKGLTIRANRARDYFLPRQDALALIEATADREWRLIIALSRFGGLRCTSEVLALRWEDVNWARRRLVIQSPKTAHHAGQGTRVIPMFPELVELLRDAFEHAADGQVCDHTVPARGELWDATVETDSPGRAHSMAQIVPQHAGFSRDGARPNLPDPRRLRMDGNKRAVAQEHYLRVTEANWKPRVVKVRFRHSAWKNDERNDAVMGEIEGNPCQPVPAKM